MTGLLMLGRPGATVPTRLHEWTSRWEPLGGATVTKDGGLLTADVHQLWTGGRPFLPFLLGSLTQPAPPAPVFVGWERSPDDTDVWRVTGRVGCDLLPDRSAIRVQWNVTRYWHITNPERTTTP